ncbi:MAG: hypothetical protein ABEJ42_10460 [Halobacteriaceae archaeon]
MHRRHLLAAVGLGAATAGCAGVPGTGDGPDDGSTGTPSPTSSTDPTTTTAGPTPTVPDGLAALAVRKAVHYESMMGSGGVYAATGTQYVVAQVEEGGEPDAYRLETDAGTFEPGLPAGAGAMNRTVAGIPVQWTEDATAVGFAVPSPLETTSAAIVETGGAGRRIPLGEAAVATLAAPEPRFALRSLEVPETVDRGRTLTVSLTVENTSGTDGRFLAALSFPTERVADDDESTIVDRQVDAGETVTVERGIGTGWSARETGTLALSVRGHVDAERDVRVVVSTATTATGG